MFYKVFIKPILFLFPAEKAHFITLFLFKGLLGIPLLRKWIRQFYFIQHENLQKNYFGLSFSNPVGLAAGFDKDGRYINVMSALGFGFIEIGTVTPKPQPGNPKPRLFRLPLDKSLINRMGFNNQGLESMVNHLGKKPKGIIIGGNIGKNKDTPNENAVNDYLICFEKLFPLVDYFVVNVSSPNTPGLRALQQKEPLTDLLHQIQNLNFSFPNPKPVFLKIAPDLSNHELDDIIEIIYQTKVNGIIATNTTVDRDNLQTDSKIIENIGAGGLSGAALKKRSTEVIKYISEKSSGKIFIIGVGGIDSPEAAKEKLEAGASLIQIYSGLVYEGPGLVKKINRYLINFSQVILK